MLNKRPRRRAQMEYERDDDPYVYESIVPRGPTARRRKLDNQKVQEVPMGMPNTINAIMGGPGL